ncbi:Rhomboid-like protein 19 [Nymphaea thermarum]|nr:Rhomboid-like protein 19 [Nymphaea thermarum]
MLTRLLSPSSPFMNGNGNAVSSTPSRSSSPNSALSRIARDCLTLFKTRSSAVNLILFSEVTQTAETTAPSLSSHPSDQLWSNFLEEKSAKCLLDRVVLAASTSSGKHRWSSTQAFHRKSSCPTVGYQHTAVLFVGKQLEPRWGSREFLKFIFVVNLLTSICVFIITIALCYITRRESFLYDPMSGFQTVLSGFLVGVKQILPDQELQIFFLLKIKAKWLPSLFDLGSTIVSFFVVDPLMCLPVVTFGTYMSWIYLRYLQRKPETSLKGDPSDEFAIELEYASLSFFTARTFPAGRCSPLVGSVSAVLERSLCGRYRASIQPRGHVLWGTPLPGLDSIEASRRRQRGARALEERLAAEKADARVDTERATRVGGPESV